MSARADFTFTLMTQGLPVAGASIVVTSRISGAVVTPYTSETGNTLAASSTLTTDANGKAAGNWYPIGDYVVSASKGGVDLGAGIGAAITTNWNPTGGVSTVINVRESPYGAKGDGRVVNDAAITTGTTQLTSATAAFTASDVGKRVNVVGAGAAGALLSTTIATFTNSTTVQLATTAGTTVSGKILTIATDDTTAVNNACTDAHNNGGGVVYFPQVVGFYGLNAMISVPDDVWIRGGGRTGTRLTWMSELGSGVTGLLTGSNTTNPLGTPSGSNYPIISDLEIVGPGDQNAALGTAPCQCSGVGLQSNGRVKQCNFYGWFGGVVFAGNHQSVEDCASKANYYGAYFVSATTFGDQYFSATELVGNKRAGIGIHGDGTYDSGSCISLHLGFSPYGVYKENNGSYSRSTVTNCVFTDLAFEACGNAGMFDQGKTASAGKDWNNNTFNGGGIWGRDVTYKIAAEASDYMWVAHNVYNTKFLPPSGWQPGALGYLDINNIYDVEVFDGRATLASIVSTALPILKAANAAQGSFTIWSDIGARCRVLKYGGAAGSCARWDVLYMVSSSGLYACSKQNTDVPVGVVQHASADANWVVVAIEGPTTVNVQTTYSTAFYVKCDLTNRGKVIVATTTTDAGIIGYSNAGTGASTGAMMVRL